MHYFFAKDIISNFDHSLHKKYHKKSEIAQKYTSPHDYINNQPSIDSLKKFKNIKPMHSSKLISILPSESHKKLPQDQDGAVSWSKYYYKPATANPLTSKLDAT